MKHLLLPAIAALSLAGCVKTKGPPLVSTLKLQEAPERESPPPDARAETETSWKVSFTKINVGAPGSVSGSGTFTLKGDEVRAMASFSGVGASIGHLQAVRLGTTCPTMSSDTNSDGWIDASEATTASGEVLIPLDGDIGGQAEGLQEYPQADATGNYSYDKSASFSKMLADLKAPDTTPDDEIAKLDQNEELQLGGKVVLIHGVPSSVNLPTTVVAPQGLTPHETLPIACGVIEKVEGGDQEGGGTTGGTMGHHCGKGGC